MTQDSTSFEEEVGILTWYFNLIGLPFHHRITRGGYATTAKQCLKLLVEFLFYAFGVYVAYNSVAGCPDRSWFIRLTTCSMSVLVVALRVAVCRKRAQILEVLSEIGRFAETCRSPPKRLCMRREIRLIAFLNIAFPLASSFAFMVLMVGSYEELKHQLKPDLVTLCRGYTPCAVASIFFISAAYAFHFFVVPSLCMMLIVFVYVRYESALAQTLSETHQRLTSDLSFESIERSRIKNDLSAVAAKIAYLKVHHGKSSLLKPTEKSMSLVVRATRLHGLIEGALSPGVFVTYVLVFVNFLNLVIVHVTSLADELLAFRSLGCAFVFLWTTAGFFRMTLSGSRLTDICERWRAMQLDMALTCMRLRRDEFLMHLVLFNDAAKLELSFTGWGMFQLRRSLVLSMAEMIVSYGVLIATL